MKQATNKDESANNGNIKSQTVATTNSQATVAKGKPTIATPSAFPHDGITALLGGPFTAEGLNSNN